MRTIYEFKEGTVHGQPVLQQQLRRLRLPGYRSRISLLYDSHMEWDLDADGQPLAALRLSAAVEMAAASSDKSGDRVGQLALYCRSIRLISARIPRRARKKGNGAATYLRTLHLQQLFLSCLQLQVPEMSDASAVVDPGK